MLKESFTNIQHIVGYEKWHKRGICGKGLCCKRVLSPGFCLYPSFTDEEWCACNQPPGSLPYTNKFTCCWTNWVPGACFRLCDAIVAFSFIYRRTL